MLAQLNPSVLATCAITQLRRRTVTEQRLNPPVSSLQADAAEGRAKQHSAATLFMPRARLGAKAGITAAPER